MSSKVVYSKLQIETYHKLKAFADATGQSVSVAIEDLILKGFAQLSSKKDSAQSKDKVRELEKEKTLEEEASGHQIYG